MSIGYAKELARILSFLGFFQIHSNADLMMHAEAVHTFVRKTAHFTEYAVLGFFTYKAVSCDVKDRKKAVLMAQLISTGYASTDEIHQMFVPGREGKVFDVMIDSCGAFCGIMAVSYTHLDVYKRQVPYNKDMMEVHDLMDHIEMRLMEEYHCEATIHMDPVVTDDRCV